VRAVFLAVGVALAVGVGAEPGGPESVPDGGQVIVSGVTDRFDETRAAVERVTTASGRDYRIVVVDTARADGGVEELLDRLVARWQASATKGNAYDPATDVTIVVATQDREIAMKVPWNLEINAGLDRRKVETELIKRVFQPRARDGMFDRGLADLVDATEKWVADDAARKKARAAAMHTFRTRTLPLGIVGLTSAGAAGAFLLQRARHARRTRAARERLARFKEEVVALSDLLDGEQERHRMLPHTDPDYLTPMAGQTRAAYDNVQTSIRRYRERWLGLMEVWEKAEEKVASEWFLGTAAADEAIELLDSAEARPPLDEVAGECRGPLDMLELAHERARELRDEVDAAIQTADTRIATLAGRGRSGAAFQEAVAAIARDRGQAAEELESDPLAAHGRLSEAAAGLAAVQERLEAVEAADDRRLRAVAAADEIDARVRALRAEGWLLAETGADPDDRLVRSRRACGIAAGLLDAGELSAAVAHLEAAETANAEAVAVLESVVAARARADELLPVCVARLDAVGARREAAVRSLDHVGRTFADSAWSDVADNIAKGDEGFSHAATLVEAARAAREPGRQEYFRAVALLEEASRQLDWVEACHAGITDRRSELDELLATLPRRRDGVSQRVVTLERRLHRQQTDRARANERCREAGRLVEAAGAGLSVVRPDVRQVGQIVEAAEASVVRAEQLADEDERLARQAEAGIDEAEQVVRRAGAWYSEGVQADVRGATATLDTARSLLGRQRYEESIHAAAEAAEAARAAYAAATAEAERRRRRRLQEIQQRQLAESFARMNRGAGPWTIQLPGGTFTGPDPWRTLGGGIGRSAGQMGRTVGSGWSRDIAKVSW
jgi:uncharacterized membrane protein YgcG